MDQKHLIFLMLLGVLFGMLLSGCTSAAPQKTAAAASGKMVIATTFYPLYDLAQKVAGPDAEVFSIVPAGIEPHGFEPTPKEIARVSEATAYILLGTSFAPFEEKIVYGLPSSVSVIVAGKGVPLLIAGDEHDAGDEEGNSGNDPRDTGPYDPHIWLSPVRAQIMVENIKTGLVLANPSGAGTYERNADTLNYELRVLDEEFRQGLSSCRRDVILVNHDAFSYLADAYGFSLVSISGIEPEGEPSPGELRDLIDAAQEHGIRYIFSQPRADSRVTDTLAREIGAETLLLNPLEGAADASQDYFSLMRQNLKNLRKALECS